MLSLGCSFRIDVEGVLDQPPGHPWHVRWLPREDVSISPEEAEHVFLFGVEPHAYHGSLAAVASPEVDGLHLYFRARLISARALAAVPAIDPCPQSALQSEDHYAGARTKKGDVGFQTTDSVHWSNMLHSTSLINSMRNLLPVTVFNLWI
jgi:hypothetical protein